MKTIERILLAILFWVALVALPAIIGLLEYISLKNLIILFTRKIYLTKNRFFLEKEINSITIHGKVISFSKNIRGFGEINEDNKFTTINKKIVIGKTAFLKVKSYGEVFVVEIPLSLYFKFVEEYLKHQKTYKMAQEYPIYREYYKNPIRPDFSMKVYGLKKQKPPE